MKELEQLNVFQRLLNVQKTAKAPREISGKFGKGRSAEQILEAYKPVCNDNGLYLNTSDEIVYVGDRHYVTTTATVTNIDMPDETHSASASAWEGNIPLSNSGSEILDTSQVSGKTSSYAKKYALQNLFAIDDTKDADRDDESVVYNSRKLTPVIRNRTEEVANGSGSFKTMTKDEFMDGVKGSPRNDPEPFGDETLGQAKLDIFAELNKQGYKEDEDKMSFIMFAIGKERIENIEDAREVAKALDNQE